MSENLPDPYGWLYYGAPDGPLFRPDQPDGLYWLCVSSAPVYSHEQMRAALAEAAALRRERDELKAGYGRLLEEHNALLITAKRSRDERVALTADLSEVSASHAELAARLAEIERQEPVAWIRFVEDGGYQGPIMDCDRRIDDTRRKLWTPLIARPTKAAAPEQADPADLLRAVLSTEVARGTLHKLRDGQGIDTTSGRAWLAAFAWAGESPEWAEPTDAEPVTAEWPDGFEKAAQSLPTLADAAALFDDPAGPRPCRCRRCMTERGDRTVLMILCPTCGNKRCPHATDHRHDCTGSNEIGQPGSWYGGMPEPASPCRCGPDGCSDSVACPKGGSS